MCGISGIFGPGGGQSITPMIASMRHRGPDDQGEWSADGISMGMCRLAVIDPTPSGHQPMMNHDESVIIVYNGETYNFQEERTELEALGHSFHSGTDTEVLLAMYETHGDDFLKRLRGMFALAIYDRRPGPGREKLILARDPFGMKPLLYSQTDHGLVFASEMKSMLASGLVGKEVSREALNLLLRRGSIPQPLTMLKDVFMLPAGHVMIVGDGQTTLSSFWDFERNRRPELIELPWEERLSLFRATLEDSVEHHMISDVPVGVFLSGGVDSSVLAALFSRRASGMVNTFSVGYGDEGRDIDETDDAEIMARHIGSTHHRVVVDGGMAREHLEHAVLGLDQPSVDGINSYFVSKAAREKVTVALSGTGSDELLAGYPWFANLLSRSQESKLSPEQAREFFRKQYFIFEDSMADRLTGSTSAMPFPLPPTEPADWPPLDLGSWFCMRGYTQNQLLRDIDAVSMIHSLEIRLPYLDREIADIAFSLPPEDKLTNTRAASACESYRSSGIKRILVESCNDLLPEGFADRCKRGFGMPFGSWLRGSLRDIFEDTLSESSVRARGLFDPQAVRDVKKEFLTGNGLWAYPWLLMVVELWCRLNLDNPSGGHKC